MVKIGTIVEAKGTGFNLGFPTKYLTGMGLQHLKPALECLYTYERCVVIGRSEYYENPVLAIERVVDGKIFVIFEEDANVVSYSQKAQNAAALNALETVISNMISLYYEEDFRGYEPDDKFDYQTWYEHARDKAYNEKHILVLREFIENC